MKKSEVRDERQRYTTGAVEASTRKGIYRLHVQLQGLIESRAMNPKQQKAKL